MLHVQLFASNGSDDALRDWTVLMDHHDMLEVLLTGSTDSLSRRGHASMLENQELPKDTPETDAILVRLGFQLKGDSPRKKFQKVVFPEGWTIKLTDHRMYSDLLDPKGRRRGNIGYEAQDGWASFYLVCRFRPTWTKDDHNDRESPAIAVIEDSNKKQLWRGPTVEEVDRSDPLWAHKEQAHEAAVKIASKKLDEIAPKWTDVEAYWGDDGDAIIWPKHETPLDTREYYTLRTSCYKNRDYKDGGEHSSCRAKDDEEAEEKLFPKVADLLTYYDEIHWTIMCNDRAVKSDVMRKPPPPPKFGGFGREYHDYRDFFRGPGSYDY